EIPEQPGSFLRFCRALGKRSVTEFNYRYADARAAQVFAGVELNGGDAERQALITQLQEKGYPVVDMTDNETAKLHIRYMVGGHAPAVSNENLFRFQFPERPGALASFLSEMGRRWNISLFHYRNHGAAYGRILMGVQLGPGERREFQAFIRKLGYPCVEETDNPAYRLFACGGSCRG
ncbi:MAG TPA: threonine ammonia-lyase, biosynthetic, partial [Sedimenticola sp.]|nr:threonine ammonia-lyase, biosynthetic [Sedimenticola sp.]